MCKYMKICIMAFVAVPVLLFSSVGAENVPSPINEINLHKVKLGMSLGEVIKIVGPPDSICFAEKDPVRSSGWDVVWPDLKVRFKGTYSGLKASSIESSLLEWRGETYDKGTSVTKFEEGVGDSLRVTDWPTSDGNRIKRCFGVYTDENGERFWCSLEVFTCKGQLDRSILTLRNVLEQGLPWPSLAEISWRDKKIFEVPDF